MSAVSPTATMTASAARAARTAVARPRADDGARVVRERADDREGAHVLTQRQRLALVLQQHQGARRHLARRAQVFGVEEDGRLARLVHVRPFEEAGAELDAQDAPDGLV